MSSLRAFATVFQREVMERRLLLVAALVVSLAPLLMPLLPRTSVGTSEMRSATALALAGTFGAVVALMLGGSVIARDLAERRISFYFSRPLPAWTIWAGKLAAGAALVLVGAALTLLPALLAGDNVDPSGYWGLNRAGTVEAFFLGASALLVLLLVGHAVGVILRSRSPWLILDLVALLLVGWLLLNSVGVLGAVGASKAFVLLGVTVLCMIPLALLTASAVQVTRGRTDLRRSHRLLSLTLWGILLSLAFAAQGVSRWVTTVTPRHLEQLEHALPAPVGDWVYVQGEAVHRGDFTPAFLLDTSNGEFVQVPPHRIVPWGVRMTFSADGRRAAWTRWIPPGAVALETVDLTNPEAGFVQTPITFNWFVADLALSPDGRHIAALVGDRLQVDEFPSGKILASVPLSWKMVDDLSRVVFDGRFIRIAGAPFDTVKVASDRRVLHLYEYDLASKELTQTGQIDFYGMSWDISDNDDPERLVMRNRLKSAIQVYDARTGQLRLTVPVSAGASVRASLLSGDRLALAMEWTGQTRRSELHILGGDGAPLRRLQFSGHITFGGQPTPGTLVVASAYPRVPETSWLIDLDTGSVKRIGDSLMPLGSENLRPGSTGTKLFAGKDGRILWIDPVTGRQRIVLPGQR